MSSISTSCLEPRARGGQERLGDGKKNLAFKKLVFMTTAPLLDSGNYASELLGEGIKQFLLS